VSRIESIAPRAARPCQIVSQRPAVGLLAGLALLVQAGTTQAEFVVEPSARLVSDAVVIPDDEPRRATVLGIKTRMAARWETGAGRLALEVTPYAAQALEYNAHAGNRIKLAADGRTAGDPAWAYVGEAALAWDPRQDLRIQSGLQSIPSPFFEPDNTRIFAPTFKGAFMRYQAPDCRTALLGRATGVIPRGRTHVQGLQTNGAGQDVPSLTFAAWEAGCADEVRTGLHLARAAGAWDQAMLVFDVPVNGVGFVKGNAIRTWDRSAGQAGHDGQGGSAASVYLALGTRARHLRLGAQWVGRGRDHDWLAETDGNALIAAYGGDYNLAGERTYQLRMNWAPAPSDAVPVGAVLWTTYGSRHPDQQPGSNREQGSRLFTRPLAWSSVGKLSASLVHVRYRRSTGYPGLSYDRTQLSLSLSL
jgi:hypothetical protein